MKVYVAGHDQAQSKEVARSIADRGHTIVSSWLYLPFHRTDSYSIEERVRIAAQDADEVMDCDLLVLCAGNEKVSGGKFVEVGIAIGRNKRISLLGRRENMLMYHPNVVAFDSLEDLLNDI